MTNMSSLQCSRAVLLRLQSILMMFNGVAILNNERFLEKCEQQLSFHFVKRLYQCSSMD